MNVSSISSTSNTFNSTGNESAVKQLQNQVNKLQNQIITENQSKDDAKTKQGKVQLLEAQLIQIQAQIQQSSTQNVSSVQATQAQPNSSNNPLSSEQTTPPMPNYSRNIIDVQI